MCAQPGFLPLEQMQMVYSADDIAVARSLQSLALSSAGYVLGGLVPIYSRLPLNLFIQIYDYVCSLHEEWTFLLRSRWTKVKALHIMTRYVPFCLITEGLYLTFAPNEDPNTCRVLINIYSCLGVISLICSEGIFVLRTSAFWNDNRIILVAMMSTFFAIVVSSFGIWFTAVAAPDVMTGAIPSTQGCYWDPRSVLFFLSFILLFVFQLGLISLTLIHVIQSWRSDNGHLHVVLMKHNIFYYACGLYVRKQYLRYDRVIDVTHTQSTYNSFLETLQVFVLSILATRMHLHLWNTDRRMRGSDAFHVTCRPSGVRWKRNVMQGEKPNWTGISNYDSEDRLEDFGHKCILNTDTHAYDVAEPTFQVLE
ncbi:hypothetical protein EDB19DRAFT_2025508 [Suillus lakei]|nr:hypothetical protein EDB19DRAFT_2025508 [Suillus lakei]